MSADEAAPQDPAPSREVQISLQKVSELTAEQVSAVSVLRANVYPPEWIANWAGRSIEWSAGQWCAICWSPEQEALSYVGGIIRTGMVNGAPAKIGGVGGVKTHTSARRQRLAARGIERVLQLFREQEVDFALLVCEPTLIPLYERLGWHSFAGDLIVTQRGEQELFTFNLPMTQAICGAAPTGGAIDLLGPPW